MKHKFLDLGRQPITNSFLTMNDLGNEYFYNLAVGFDDKTKLVSLMDFVDPEGSIAKAIVHKTDLLEIISGQNTNAKILQLKNSLKIKKKVNK